MHCNDVVMSTMGSQITGFTIDYLIVCSGTNQRQHQSSASQAFVRGIYRWQVDSPHKGPVTRKMFTFDDVIMVLACVTKLVPAVNVERVYGVEWFFCVLQFTIYSHPFLNFFIDDQQVNMQHSKDLYINLPRFSHTASRKLKLVSHLCQMIFWDM